MALATIGISATLSSRTADIGRSSSGSGHQRSSSSACITGASGRAASPEGAPPQHVESSHIGVASVDSQQMHCHAIGTAVAWRRGGLGRMTPVPREMSARGFSFMSDSFQG